MSSQFINDPEGNVGEASSSPPPKSAPRRVTRQTQNSTYSNPCCCYCTLTEAVIWIAVLEIIWNLTNLLVQLSSYVPSKASHEKVQSGATVDTEDLVSSKFYKDYLTSMTIAMIMFGVGVGLGVLLLVAVSSRIRGLCYVWIGGIFLVAVGHIINMIVYNYKYVYPTIFWIPLLIYFAIVVAAYANEIRLYPEGPPIVVHPVVNAQYMNSSSPVVYAQPVVYGGYGGGYGYGYPPGYGYGYHAGDAAVAGLALGMGAGMMMGGCDYGYGGCGFYDDCMMF